MSNELLGLQDLQTAIDQTPKLIEATFEDGDVFAANQLAKLSLDLDDEIAKVNTYLKELKTFKTSLDAQALQGAIENQIVELGALKLKANPESVEITDAESLPEQFIITKTTQTPDKTAIKNALKLGIDIPGAELTRTKKLAIDKKKVIINER